MKRAKEATSVGERVDPITVSVIQHRLEAIVQEMGEAMLRTSYSQILNSSRDFSTALCDAEGRLVAQAEHVPIHVGAIPWAVRSVQEFFGDRVRPGDVYLLNDPYHGNNHLPDLTAFVPVFAPVGRASSRSGGLPAARDEEPPQADRIAAEARDRPVFWSINRSHQSDIGGATHGAYNPSATEIWQEGIRITPLRLYEAGVVRDDVLKMIATNVRHPRDFQGDLAAMIGSARVGERRLLALLDEYGAPTVGPAIEAILDGAERQTRACIAEWKDGVYRGEAILDDDGHGFRDVYIRATVTKRGSDLTVDLSDSHPQVIGFVNSSYPNMRSAVAMALAYLIDPETPKNDGTFRPLTVVARAGTVVWANPPAPLTLCTNHCAQEIAESVIKALAPACPTRVLAGWGRRFRIAIQGRDPRSGRPFIWHMFHARPGGGASPAGDGWPTAGEGQAAGGIKFGSVEVTEVRFPLFFARHEFRPDSGGDGRYRGGPGSILDLHVEIAEPARANTAGDGTRHAPYGVLGGKDGLPHRYRLRSRGRRDRVLRTKEVGVVVRPGDVFLVESGGGGGYGDPRQRAPEARAYDRENGFVTRSAPARRAGIRAAPAPPARRPKPARGGRKGR
jgi:N-methylhydantoinase B